ncbi:MAG: hypothetical protein ACFBRM_02035 [Pikeienuella sp.]
MSEPLPAACPAELNAQDLHPIDGGESEVVVIGRAGGTPLRFRGRRLFLCRGSVAGRTVRIALWRCRPSGYVVHVLETERGWRRSRADRAMSLEAAIGVLQAAAPISRDSPGDPKPGRRLTARMAAHRVSRSARRGAVASLFDELVGECAAQWPELAAKSTPERLC